MRLSEAHADISVHLMTLNPGPGHGGMSCTSPSKSTFSMAWHHNRNAKNAQSPAEGIAYILSDAKKQWKPCSGVIATSAFSLKCDASGRNRKSWLSSDTDHRPLRHPRSPQVVLARRSPLSTGVTAWPALFADTQRSRRGLPQSVSTCC